MFEFGFNNFNLNGLYTGIFNPFLNSGVNAFNTTYTPSIFGTFSPAYPNYVMPTDYMTYNPFMNIFNTTPQMLSPQPFTFMNSFPQLNFNNSYNFSNYYQNYWDFGLNNDFTTNSHKTESSHKTTHAKKSSTRSNSEQTSTQASYTDFKIDKEFIDKVKEISKRLNCDYKDLLAVMNSESGINPQAWNGNTAVGLIQFTNIALAEINQTYGTSYTKEQVGQMSGLEQLDLVEKFLTVVKKRNFASDHKLSAGDLYAMVFAPSKANQEVLYKKGSAAYAQNPLDLNNDGVITKQDLAEHLQRKQVNLIA